MPKKTLVRAFVICLLAGSLLPAFAQPLQKVKLRPVFPALKLDRGLWMSEAPDGSGRFFVAEQNGRIIFFPKNGDGSDAGEFLNITDRKPHVDNNNVGLLGMALHPGFKTNGLSYVFYSQMATNRNTQYPRRSIISEFKASATNANVVDLSSERILFEVPEPAAGNQGGELCFGPDGYLYIGVGDGGPGNDPSNYGQNTSTFLAKILRIDVNTRGPAGRGRGRGARPPAPYGIPTDNPFVGEPDLGGAGVRKEIYAYGFREPWRFSFDRQTGELWAGDVGQDLWEEIDIVVKGGNYGWCVREALHHFKPGPVGAQYIDPVMEYPHRPDLLEQSKFPQHGIGICVIGGYVYRGRKFPALQGVYLYSDNGMGTIWGLRYKDGKVTEDGTLLAQPKNIASFAEDSDGELYVLAFDVQTEYSAHIYAVETE